MFTPLSPLSTRILSLSGFPPQLKTRDIQSVFSAWEDDNGGFRIKWVDDTNAMVIFSDPSTAKRAYLATLMSPPPLLMTSQGVTAKVRPYDGDDAASIIASVQHRTRSRSIANGSGFGASGSFSAGGGGGEHSPIDERSEAPFASSSTSSAANAAALPGSGSPSRPGHRTSISNASTSMDMAAHRRRPSVTASASLPAKPVAAAMFDAAQGGPSPARHLANAAAAERAAQAELAQMKVKAVEAAVQEEIEEQEEAEKNGEKGAGQHKGGQQEAASASVGA